MYTHTMSYNIRTMDGFSSPRPSYHFVHQKVQGHLPLLTLRILCWAVWWIEMVMNWYPKSIEFGPQNQVQIGRG